jgi:Zn-dependent metalloprotease
MASPDSRALDVIVREFTHAVTQAESDLTYTNESDGMNEAMSDIMATYCESWSRPWVVDSKTWRVGEDVWTPATANDALRCIPGPHPRQSLPPSCRPAAPCAMKQARAGSGGRHSFEGCPWDEEGT